MLVESPREEPTQAPLAHFNPQLLCLWACMSSSLSSLMTQCPCPSFTIKLVSLMAQCPSFGVQFVFSAVSVHDNDDVVDGEHPNSSPSITNFRCDHFSGWIYWVSSWHL
jgi:hypothetical protein